MIPAIQGPYAYLELYAKRNLRWYFGFDVVDDTTNTGTNLATYDAVRLSATFTNGAPALTLNSNTGGITVVNVSSLLINATPEQMNLSAGYYPYDIDLLANDRWEPLMTGTIRIDAKY